MSDIWMEIDVRITDQRIGMGVGGFATIMRVQHAPTGIVVEIPSEALRGHRAREVAKDMIEFAVAETTMSDTDVQVTEFVAEKLDPFAPMEQTCAKCGADRKGWLRCSHSVCSGGEVFGRNPFAPMEQTCAKCGSEMEAGFATAQTFTAGAPDFAGSDIVTMSAGGPGRMVPCRKCKACGWSVTV